jgi:hypothetical protein
MKLATQTFVFAAALAASTMSGLGAMAHADPDPHMPNMQAGYCPGGGMGSQISLAYCDEPAPPGGCGGAVPPPPPP